MENATSKISSQPRHLHYRSHYKVYLIFFFVTCAFILPYWSLRLLEHGPGKIFGEQSLEIGLSISYLLAFSSFYFLWLRPRLSRSVQVFPTFLKIHQQGKFEEVYFNEVETVNIIGWSLFYFKMKNGHKYYFSSSLERVDYVWEKIKETRPDLVDQETYDQFRIKLVQFDHDQKRKEWFFKHKFADVINCLVLPVSFVVIAYLIQSQYVIINHKGLYFFRLGMYSLLVLLISTFLFSLLLKKFVFDKKVVQQMSDYPADKIRNMEFEGIIIQRSKFFQFATSCIIFCCIIQMDMNFYSVTKVKDSVQNTKIAKGITVVVDNRFNCVSCRYELQEGDVVMWGKGYIGQVIAKPGDYVGEIASGRGMASESTLHVPNGHLAIKSPDGSNLSFIKFKDLIGKVK